MGQTFEVAIIGGGPAGCAAALALKRRGLARVLVVEAGRYEGPRVGESIPPDTRLLIEALGLWTDFEAEGHEPCHGSASAWGSAELGYNDFLWNPYGHGWHLDRRRFDAWLARKAAEAGAEVRTGVRLERVERLDGEAFRLRLSQRNGEEMALDAHFLVDATGWQARVALRLGASRRSHDRLTFVAGFFAPGAFAGAPALTMLEAVPYGWWYAARLPDGRLVAAVGSDADRIRHAALHRPDRFRTHLVETRHIGRLFRGASCPDGPLVVYSAPSSRLDRVAGPGWLAVGDAASAFDPISSQGITKALSDGLGAGAAISGWLAGDAAALETYSASVAARFEEYLQTRAYLYAIEQRWADAPFWRRRRARSGLLAA